MSKIEELEEILTDVCWDGIKEKAITRILAWHNKHQKELDADKIRQKIKSFLQPIAMRVDSLSTKIGKQDYKPNYEDSREANLIYKTIIEIYDKLAQALLQD